MKVHKYNSYDEYVEIQTKSNKQKLACTWVDKNNIKYIVKYLFENFNLSMKFVLCHGTRNGSEQLYFIKYIKEITNINEPLVIGTEISDTATKFPNTIQWDFHNIKKEWINSVDLIYSNSFDHSYKPEECLDSWMICLKDNGICIIEYEPTYSSEEFSTETDPFGASLDEYKTMINKKYNIIDIMELNGYNNHFGTNYKYKRYFIIISKNNKKLTINI